MKTLQIIGTLIPALLIVFAYYLFGSLGTDTPLYAGASLVMLWSLVAFLAVAFVFLFILPSSFILLKEENRVYFCFKSKLWLSMLALNWFFIVLYCLCVVVFMFNFGR